MGIINKRDFFKLKVKINNKTKPLHNHKDQHYILIKHYL